MEPLNKSSTEDLFSGSLIFIGSSQFAQLLKTRFNTGDLIEITVITSQRGLQLVNGGCPLFKRRRNISTNFTGLSPSPARGVSEKWASMR